MQERTRTILFGKPKKKRDDDHSISRRELISLMFKVAFLEAMALSLILPSVVSTGETNPTCSNNIPSVLQCGIQVVTVSPGTSTGIQAVTFPTAFTTIPFVQTFPLPTVAQLSFQFQFFDTVTMVSNEAPIPWTAMPAAETEFLGLNLSRVQHLFTNGRTVSIFANVQTAGAVNAILKLQFFNVTSSLWVDVCGAGTDKPQVSISSTGEQKGATCSIISALTSPVGLGQVQVRIAGKNGDGVTTPSFGNIGFIMAIAMNVTPYAVPFSRTTTGFTIVMQTGVIQTVTQNFNVEWIAHD